VVNGVRAPKNGTLADIVEADDDLEINITVKGTEGYSKLWIPDTTLTTKKKKSVIKTEGDESAAQVRRKIKRWDEKETSLLIDLVKEHGKGKWKRVLETGAGTFDEHRTTVDLKDKWRNLERSGLAPPVAENPDIKRKQLKKEEAAAAAAAAVPAGSHLEALTGAVHPPPGIVGGFASAVGNSLHGAISTDPVLTAVGVADFHHPPATQPVLAQSVAAEEVDAEDTKTRPQRGKAVVAKAK